MAAGPVTQAGRAHSAAEQGGRTAGQAERGGGAAQQRGVARGERERIQRARHAHHAAGRRAGRSRAEAVQAARRRVHLHPPPASVGAGQRRAGAGELKRRQGTLAVCCGSTAEARARGASIRGRTRRPARWSTPSAKSARPAATAMAAPAPVPLASACGAAGLCAAPSRPSSLALPRAPSGCGA